MLSKLNRRDRMALLIGGAAVFVFVILSYVVLPLFDRFSRGQSAALQKEITLRRDQHLVSRAEFENTRVVAVSDYLKTLEAGLLENISPSLANAEWQKLVGQVADSNRIVLGSSEFLKTRDLGSGYSLITGRLQFRCRMDQLVAFLSGLAAAPKLLSVVSVSVTATQGDPQNTLNVQLTVGAAVRTTAQLKETESKQD